MTAKKQEAPAQVDPAVAAQAAAAAAAAKVEAKAAAAAQKAADKAAAAAAKAAEKEAAAAKKAADKAAADAAKAEAKKLKEEAAAQKAAEKAAKAKPQQPQNNGVTRPRPETACGKVWALADSLSAQLKQPVPISILAKATAAVNLNDATTRTQYARWKTYNGVTGIVPKPAVAEAEAATA